MLPVGAAQETLIVEEVAAVTARFVGAAGGVTPPPPPPPPPPGRQQPYCVIASTEARGEWLPAASIASTPTVKVV
jgi:hypothetical protein